MSAEDDARLSQQILIRKNMHSVIGIIQDAKDKVHVAASLIVKHQGALDKKLKVLDNALESLKVTQDLIQQEFFPK